MTELGSSRMGRLMARLSPRPAVPGPTGQALTDEIAALRSRAEEAVERGDYAIEVALDMSLPTRMLALMSWLELHEPPSGPQVSVILATRDRPELLSRAIDSVLVQRFERWQLLVVDDGATDAVPATLAAYEDDRIVTVKGPRRGLSAARNAGLARANGEVVCYQDDDNVMHPAWLHAVAHVFSQRDDVDVAYGVSIAEHRLPDDLGEHGWWPSFWQLPWSREKLLEENTTDAGSIAHRRDLAEARFDESLSTGEDWDLLLRLTADREALAVPAVSHAYSMAGADRMSHDSDHRAGLDEIRRRHAGAQAAPGDAAQ
jgi:glycosyl transferase family 2